MRPLLLLSVNIALIVAIAGVAVHQLRDICGFAVASIRRADTEAALLIDMEAARRHFEIQVRAWKDIMLHGSDSDTFETHREHFDGEERAVQILLKRVRTQAAAAGADPVDIDRLISAHAGLGAQYRVALIGFDPRLADRGRALDLRMAEVERSVATTMRQLTERLAADPPGSGAEDADVVDARFHQARTVVLLTLAIAVLLACAFPAALASRRGPGRAPARPAPQGAPLDP